MSNTTPALLAASAGVAIAHSAMPDHWAPLAVVARTNRWSLTRVTKVSALAGIAHVVGSLILGAIIIGVGLQFRDVIERSQGAVVGGVLVITGLGFLILQLTGRGHHHGPGGHSHGVGGGHAHGGLAFALATTAHDHDHDHGEHEHEHDHREHEHEHDHREHEHEHEHEHDHGDHEHDHGGGGAAHAAFDDRSLPLFRRVAAIAVPFGAAASPDLTILPVFLAASAVGVATATGTVIVFSFVTMGSIVGLTLLATIGGYQIKGAWIDRYANVITASVLIVLGGLIAANVI